MVYQVILVNAYQYAVVVEHRRPHDYGVHVRGPCLDHSHAILGNFAQAFRKRSGVIAWIKVFKSTVAAVTFECN